ncbi:uncharacterized protein LOC132794855 isoform X3 [Drosophila nasuta]|uniref:uncharacterized protein LOC132794855 isoform X3 n=1 Tax=Drosophila nasuta TaxID=42062 RepID=UPI00295E3C6C|nr:uncharacterized protein LOC132794855 isoform X3 [Drosophila nasuta]
MAEIYSSDILRIVIAEIAQTIGYSNTQNASLELLEDILLRFVKELSRDLHSQVEHANRIEPSIKDVQLCFGNLAIDIHELLDYVGNVEPVPFVREVPEYPVKRNSNMNFLKPGSAETLTRPVHIFEYLPAVLPSSGRISASSSACHNPSEIDHLSLNYQQKCADNLLSAEGEQGAPNMHKWCRQMESSISLKQPTVDNTDSIDGHAVRTINSVVMTTGGFISPAIEGKMPEAFIPPIIEKLKGLDAPPILPPLVILDTKNSITLEIGLNEKNQAAKDNAVVERKPLTEDIFLLHEISTVKKTESKNLDEEAIGSVQGNQSKPTKSQKKHLFGAELNNSKAQEKAHRKALKIYQRLSKSQVEDEAGLKKSLKHLNRAGMLSTLSSDTRTTAADRTYVEKILKKQTKRHKQLKSQKQQQHIQFMSKQLSLATNDEFSNARLNHPVVMAASMPSQSIPMLSIESSTVGNMFGSSTVEPLSADILSSDVGQSQQMHSPNDLLSDDVKLGNEPDRNKLNIFKKLSKSKPTKSLSPSALHTMASHLLSDTGNGSSTINLPSGTTITPEPALNFTENYVTSNLTSTTTLKEQTITTQSVLTSSLTELTIPKKRGRKPGVKNISARSKIPNEHVLAKKIRSSKLNATTTVSYPPANSSINTAHLSIQTESTNSIPSQHPEKLSNILPHNLDKVIGEEDREQSITFLPISNETAKNMKLKKIKEKQEKKKRKTKYNHLVPSENSIQNNSELEGNKKFPFMDVDIKNTQTLSITKESVEFNQIPSSKSPTNANAIKHFSSNLLSPASSVHGYMTGIGTLPILSFPPRPGLIPSGIFSPTSLANLNKNNKISHSFMTLPDTISRSSSAIGYGSSLHETTSEKKSTEISMLPLSDSHTERSYCNVAPLVPESMKMTVLSSDGHKLKSANASIEGEGMEIKSGKNVQGLSKSAHFNQRLGIRSKGQHDKLLINKLEKSKTTKVGTGKLGDPIEVSDDSNDNDESNIQQKTDKINSDGFLHSSKKFDISHPHSVISNPSSIAADFNQFKKLATIKVNPLECSSPLSVIPQSSSSAFNINFMGNDKFSLAGGADLIPLSCVDSGLAYSSRTVPVTSLTAGATSESSVQTHGLSSEHSFVCNMVNSINYDDITITPTNNLNNSLSDLKLHKLHKKPKKTKEGKSKKKKDKKDKTKSKDKGDDKSMSMVEKPKSVDKKQKKDKKKDKLVQTNVFMQLSKDNLDCSNKETPLNSGLFCRIR